jgi:hypothetical protein
VNCIVAINSLLGVSNRNLPEPTGASSRHLCGNEGLLVQTTPKVGACLPVCHLPSAICHLQSANFDILLPKRSYPPSPPSLKIHRTGIDPQFPQSLARQMTIIRSLHASLGIITLCICNHLIEGRAHDIGKKLADLVFREPVFGGEMKDFGEAGLGGKGSGDVFVCNI